VNLDTHLHLVPLTIIAPVILFSHLPVSSQCARGLVSAYVTLKANLPSVTITHAFSSRSETTVRSVVIQRDIATLCHGEKIVQLSSWS